jgi:hypothetical protein
MRPRLLALAAMLVVAGGWQAAGGASGLLGTWPQRGNAGGRGGQRSSAAVLDVRVPDHAADVILARPTPTSITVSLIVYRDSRVFVAYGTREGELSRRTEAVGLDAGRPRPIVIAGLLPDTRYVYEVRSAATDAGAAATIGAGAFRTARPPGSGPFVFTVTADSHLDDRVAPEVYQRTLNAAHGDGPDFHVDLGDTFMTERHEDRQSAARQYLAQRYYFGQLARSAPLFLVLGNHDGEGRRWAEGDDSLAAWSNGMRKRHFPNPVPDGYYTGNASVEPHAGLLEDYYAWRWGDALFVVLDPFWYSNRRGGDDGWAWTLGQEQYRWLARTLAQSNARCTFVFIHHLVGGDQQARGGAEASRFFEWGGANADGTPGFASRRRGWESPIHDLLVRHGVTAVFHGHDHFYAHQERDGIAYQEVPQPGDARGGSARAAVAYGYTSGTVLGGTGYLRVKMGADGAMVEYVDMQGGGLPGRIADRYLLRPANRSATTRLTPGP